MFIVVFLYSNTIIWMQTMQKLIEYYSCLKPLVHFDFETRGKSMINTIFFVIETSKPFTKSLKIPKR